MGFYYLNGYTFIPLLESMGIIFDEYLCSMGTYTPEFTVCVYCNFNILYEIYTGSL